VTQVYHAVLAVNGGAQERWRPGGRLAPIDGCAAAWADVVGNPAPIN
jgi:hypothetical protein